MEPPRDLQGVQRLNGRIIALGRFISCSAQRCLPFYKAIKKEHPLKWSADCQAAFNAIKSFLATPPLLSVPVPEQDIHLYFTIADETVGVILTQEKGTELYPIYFLSKVLKGAEVRYSEVEKALFAITQASERLRPYFQAHTVVVRTNYPLKKTVQKPEVSGRITNWSVRLSQFDVQFVPRTTIKAQVLSDFIVEFTGSSTTNPKTTTASTSYVWTMSIDGSCAPGRAGAGIAIQGPNNLHMRYAVRLNFLTTNNQAEYEALIAALRLSKTIANGHLTIYSDSKLIVSHVSGTYKAKDPTMCQYLALATSLINDLKTKGITLDLILVPREENEEADAIAALTAGEQSNDLSTLIEVAGAPAIRVESSLQIDLANAAAGGWRCPIIKYLQDGTLPADRTQASLVVRRSWRYALHDDLLYRKSATHPWLRCISEEEGDHCLKEIHQGVCSSHQGARTIAKKARLQGLYWQTLDSDATRLVRGCQACQLHANTHHTPMAPFKGIVTPWPFTVWGVDLLGPFPMALAQKRFVVVAVDHFTKWIEAEAIAKITADNVIGFLKRAIIYRFRVPHSFITDNGRQFDCGQFRDFCAEWGIKGRYTSVAHPQSNGLTEVSNRTLL
ncbi:uncharacterized protein [Euphorbia lathyris]|uniref:uncharacterized protein n=1 Tax=Euphorbia lathyris TaxID=212925 RepID=UPI0033137092